jgi:hypothetical protein
VRCEEPSLVFDLSHLFVFSLIIFQDFGGSMVPVGFLGDKTEEEQYTLRAQELNQGRAAMMGILACMVHEQLNGKPFIFFEL